MKAIYALYPDGAAAQAAVNRLRAAGLDERRITIRSARPMSEWEFGRIDRATWMWWIACLGGLVGAGFAALYVRAAATQWELNVGGLPTISWWSAGVITFEMTMLGAVLASVATFIVSAGLGRGRGVLGEPDLSGGRILVGVERPSASTVDAVRAALGASSTVIVRTL